MTYESIPSIEDFENALSIDFDKDFKELRRVLDGRLGSKKAHSTVPISERLRYSSSVL